MTSERSQPATPGRFDLEAPDFALPLPHHAVPIAMISSGPGRDLANVGRSGTSPASEGVAREYGAVRPAFGLSREIDLKGLVIFRAALSQVLLRPGGKRRIR